MKLIDLSHSVINDMPIFPGDDPVKLFQDKTLEKDHYNNFKLEIGMHSGTHIDTPLHMSNEGRFINEIPLDRFMGKGCILDVRGEDVITYKDKYANLVSKGDILLLYTDHSRKWGTGEYFEKHPIIDESLADFFIEKEIKILGMDLPSPDKYPFKIHQKLFKHHILIIENMTNLSKLLGVKDFEIMTFPIKVRAEAAMVRVVAKIQKI